MDAADFAKSFLSALKDPEIRSTLADIVAEQLKNEITLLRKELKEKNQQISNLQNRVASLESENDSLEQYTRRNSLRVFGVPEEEGENTVELAISLINETMEVQPPITIEDIDRVHRTGKKDSPTSRAAANSTQETKPRAILVKFATYRARHRVMSNRKKLKGTKIFVNEDLTRARSTTLYKARMMKRNGTIRDIWTHDGSLVFKDKNNKIHSGRSLQQCEELMKSFVNNS